MKDLGPSFFSELQAAGLAGLPFSWNASGVILYGPEITAEERAAIDAVVLAHDPSAPAPEPEPDVPEVVSRFQGREAMHQTPYGEGSLFEATEAALDNPDTPAMYRRAWDDLQEFHFDSEMLIALATSLGLTEQDRKNLFILAGSIKV